MASKLVPRVIASGRQEKCTLCKVFLPGKTPVYHWGERYVCYGCAANIVVKVNDV